MSLCVERDEEGANGDFISAVERLLSISDSKRRL